MVDCRIRRVFHLKLVDNGYRAAVSIIFSIKGGPIFNRSSVCCSRLLLKEVVKVSKMWMQPLNYGGITNSNVSPEISRQKVPGGRYPLFSR